MGVARGTLGPWSPNMVARWPVFHWPGRYFTENLAEASILKISARSRYFENTHLENT